MFLATNDQITVLIKNCLQEVSGYEDLLCDIINICVKHYEEKSYLVPDEKHMLLKVIGFSLSLMPTQPNSQKHAINIYKLHQNGKLNLSKIDRFFKDLQVVTLYGDMQIPLGYYIQRMADYKDNIKFWSCIDTSIDIKTPLATRSELKPPESANYNLATRLKFIRNEHGKYISELSHKNSRYQVVTAGSHTNNDDITKNKKNNKEMYNLALKGLKLLSKWTCQVMEIYSWKLVHPTNHKNSPECPKDAEEYERSTRYNYNSREKFAMVELLGMIKGLQVLMTRMDSIFVQAIKSHIYTELQNFVQIDLRELLRVSSKKNKTMIQTLVNSIRNTAGDWPDNFRPSTDPANKGEKDSKSGFRPTTPKSRSVGPASTQLYIVRTMLEHLISEKSVERKTIKNLVDENVLRRLDQFYNQSFFYSRLLNFSETLPECCDLSQLWFREFFLELTMGARIQFPIEMSMPWILTDHILETKEATMMEYILYPLDLYWKRVFRKFDFEDFTRTAQN